MEILGVKQIATVTLMNMCREMFDVGRVAQSIQTQL